MKHRLTRLLRSWELGGGLLVVLACMAMIVALGGCSASKPGDDAGQSQVHIQYWEKWTGFEAEAMQKVIDKFHTSQNRIRVEYLTTAQIERKLLLATAGGNPPDVGGFWSHRLIPYSEMGALTPLNSLMAQDGITSDSYLPVVNTLCTHRGFYFGLPSTPACVALHYNKKLFREAGLDPEKPPKTTAELSEYARKLTKIDEKGNIVQLGFNPMDPGWWNDQWGCWFGGKAWDGEREILINSPQNIAAFKWLQSFPKEFGMEKIQRFTAAGGQFASAQNPFIAGKLAMQLQGVWMGNFIRKYNPSLEWAAAPFPSSTPELAGVTVVECDVLVIPKGATHPREAWEFIKFVQQQANMELLCLGQTKFSPLMQVSEEFYAQHPNPYVKTFRDLAESANANIAPQMPVYSEYADELVPAVDLMWRLLETPEDALRTVKQRMQPRLDQALRQWDRIAEKRIAAWQKQ